MNRFYSTIAIVVCVLFVSTSILSAQQNFWTEKDLSQVGSRVIKKDIPKEFKLFDINLGEFKRNVKEAPLRFSDKAGSKDFVIYIPLPDGSIERFNLVSSPVFEEGILNEYPGLKSYTGIGVDDSSAFLKMSISNEKGISGMIMSSQHSTVYFDPYTDNLETCIFYYRKDRSKDFLNDFECLTEDQGINPDKVNEYDQGRNTNDQLLRDYRLAISTTGEYTQYHGGTISDALAAMNVTMTRVNGVYEKDFAVTMTIIGNTSDVIYTNPSTDPYTGSYNTQLKNTLSSEIGLANFDIGHLFHNGSNNGNAGCIGCVCSDANGGEKGSAFTSHSTPEGDNFDIDYVAHEMGHQFGGNHTWNFNGSEGTGVQAEPGSGSTIMGYAGITGSTYDVQAHSDDYFHYYNINQVSNYIQNESCHSGTTLTNAVPIANAGPDLTIPEMTAFVLKGTGTDADGDPLTFCWEQTDVNTDFDFRLPNKDHPSGTTNFRSRVPTLSPHRYMPQLSDIIAGSLVNYWETVSDVCRTLNFALVVRDNAIGGGQTDSDLMELTVDCNSGPFVVNSPNGGDEWATGSVETVNWNVAGTDVAPVSCGNVDILLSLDGGYTYSDTLAENVPNNGAALVTVPGTFSTEARIMVICSDNIFLDISNDDFEIGDFPPTVNLLPTSTLISDEGTDCNTRFITFQLSMSKEPVSNTDVAFSLAGTSTEFEDYNNLSGLNHTFTTTNWSTPIDIIIEIEQDAVVENDETIEIDIASVTGSNATIGNSNSISFTLLNDDNAPSSGGSADYVIGVGALSASEFYSPFRGNYEDERMQMIYPASELAAAGISAGDITALALNIQEKNSTQPYEGFNINFGMTSDIEFSGSVYYSGLTNVYSSTVNTMIGWNNYVFTTPFTWDGTSSLVVEVCWNNDSRTSNDIVFYDNYSYTTISYNRANNAVGCNLGTNYNTYRRAQTRFTLSAGVGVQTGINNGNGQSDVNLGPFQTIHLYDQNTGNIMASITENSGHDYGCTQVFVENEGKFASESAAGTDVWLMDKTFRVIPTTNNPVGSYDITLYYSGNEMQGWENNNGMGYTQSDIKLFKSTGNLGSASGSIEETIATVNAFGTSDWAITGTFTTGFSGIGAGGGEAILPVSLLNFNAKKEDATVSLAWRTLSEIDNSGFEVQHSENGQDWIQIGWIDSKQSHSTSKDYNFIHKNPSDRINYYRLKQVDSDGRFEYSGIRTVFFDKETGFVYFPNPVHDDLTIQIDRGIVDAKVKIISSIGQIMYEGNLNSSAQISVRNFPPGNFTIQILHEQGIESGRFVKQ